MWRRLEGQEPREAQPVPKVSPDITLGSRGHETAAPVQAAGSEIPSAAEVAVTSVPHEGDPVDGSLLGWAAHFLIEQVWSHLGTGLTTSCYAPTRSSAPVTTH